MRQRLAVAWRDLLRAVVNGLSVPVGLLAIPLLALGLLSSVIGVGVPLTIGVVRVTRVLAGWHRRRTGEVLGRAVAVPYEERPDGLRKQYVALLQDPATWRDLAWLAVNLPVGTAAAAISAGLALSGIQCLLAPAIQPLVPAGVLDPLWIDVNSRPTAWLMVLASPFVLALAVLLPGPLNRLRATVAEALLRPTAAAALRTRVGRITASRDDAVDLSAAELRRIERDLHDGAQVRLSALTMNLGIAEDMLDSDPELVRKMIVDARANAGGALREIRDLVRGIHPPVLADRGLDGAVQALALTVPVPVAVDVRLPGRLPAPVESAAYFATAEALANAIKHSGAGTVTVTVEHDGAALIATVADDGRGGASLEGGSGLRGLERRLSALDGTLILDSPAGGPTVIRVEIPCAS